MATIRFVEASRFRCDLERLCDADFLKSLGENKRVYSRCEAWLLGKPMAQRWLFLNLSTNCMKEQSQRKHFLIDAGADSWASGDASCENRFRKGES